MVESGIFQLALKLIEGLGDKGIKHLLLVFGSPDEIFKASKKDFNKIGRIRSTCIEAIIRKSTFSIAEQKLRELEYKQIKFSFYSDQDFPTRLLDLPDGPTLLYYQGKNNFNPSKTVAIVGTRNKTDYGKFVVEEFISGLQKYDCAIVSGLAYGIDITAHKEAVKHGLDTWAVIGGGHHHIYPNTHKKYIKEIKASGAVISEYFPDTKPIMAYFPARNRIIAGLSDATIVVESGAKGGALITADIADSYHREVFAVPGKISDHTSSGCNQLIRNHKAHILNSINEFEYIMGWDSNLEHSAKKIVNKNLMNQNELAVIDQIDKDGAHIDLIGTKSGIQLGLLPNILLNLELKGIVETSPGNIFRLAPGIVLDEE